MKLVPLAALLAALLVPQGEQESKYPEVGKPAPTFKLNDQAGQLHGIGDANDDWTVVAFFPKAMTPG